MALKQDNVSEWSNRFTWRLLIQWAPVLVHVKWAINQLYHGNNKLRSMKWGWCPLFTRSTQFIGSFYMKRWYFIELIFFGQNKPWHNLSNFAEKLEFMLFYINVAVIQVTSHSISLCLYNMSLIPNCHYLQKPSWSWSWSYGGWIYNKLGNCYLSPLALWLQISLMARCTLNNIMW